MPEIRQYLVDDMRQQIHSKLVDAFQAQIQIMSAALTPKEGLAAMSGALANFVAHAATSCVALTPIEHEHAYDAIVADINSALAASKQDLLPFLKALQSAILNGRERVRQA